MPFYMPVTIYDGYDTVISHRDAFGKHGKKALIVTGKNSARLCGALDDVKAALSDAQVKFCVFSEIEENPSVESAVKGSRFGLEQNADFVIGIGGGSPMDAAKAIAFLMKHDSDPDTLYDAKIPTEALDVLAVPTTCGTGSEVTGVSVLTVHDKQTKQSIPHKIFPKAAFLDGKYLRYAPKSTILNTAADALSHMLESYESKKADAFSQNAVITGLSIWKNALPYLKGEEEPSDAIYADLMRASCYAGIAIAQTGTSVPHALSYLLTYDLKMPHGKACAYFLDGYMHFSEPGELDHLLKTAGFASFEEFSAFLRSIQKDEAVPDAALQRAYDTVKQNTARLSGSRIPIDSVILKQIVNFRGGKAV